MKDLARSATTEMVLRALNRILPVRATRSLVGLTAARDEVNIQGILPMQGATKLIRLALS